jgi:putative addiction module component (TIGR02574 family)
MTKLLQKAIEEIERLSPGEQDAAAGALMDYLDHMRGVQLTDEQVAEVRRRLAEPRGETSLSEARARILPGA